ncbi:MAG: FAD-dependent 5-carboxymethylaminomethyl-2-thiouridine(34) oxidoreductase MnmC, partial [Roseateles sp.]|uniref:FAD-dependent 5-carboxymethylaminomethyl-2-thiouridine(34) oxidoreductase MnmC n=1 Tax=Roseateles sp. TaxID=1971397 RepID=UPI00403619FA
MKSPAVAPAEVEPPDPDALDQARHVFIAGSGLPGRWQGRERFVVLETGFGLGHNFLATWEAWRQDPARCGRLVFVSVEKQPPRREDLARAHAGGALAVLAAQLAERWPALTTGLHALSLDGSRVELLLGLGDTHHLLRELVLQADALYLHREPCDDWLLKSMSRHAAPGTTAATPHMSRAMGRALSALGFVTHTVPGLASRPEVGAARFAPRHALQRPPGREPLAPGATRALIIGAGLAGAACALALGRQGVACCVVDALPGPAQASSGNPAGLFHGTVNPDDGPHARFNRAAALATQRLLVELGVPHSQGLLRLETRLAVAQMLAAPGYVQPLSADAAAALAGTAVCHPAWFYPGGGAVDPGVYTRAMLAASGAKLRLGTAVAALEPHADGWQLLDAAGQRIDAAPLVVLAGGHAQLPLLGELAKDLVVQRGQISHLPDAPWCPGVPMAGDGYVIADGRGGLWCGATAQDGDLHPGLREADQLDNLQRYARLAGLDEAPRTPVAGRVAWRLVAPDRLPLIGGIAAPGPPAGQLR